jgi:hypothetical protein
MVALACDAPVGEDSDKGKSCGSGYKKAVPHHTERRFSAEALLLGLGRKAMALTVRS